MIVKRVSQRLTENACSRSFYSEKAAKASSSARRLTNYPSAMKKKESASVRNNLLKWRARVAVWLRKAGEALVKLPMNVMKTKSALQANVCARKISSPWKQM